MSTTENKINAILDAINQDIAEREKEADSAMLTLEQMNTSVEDYKDACKQFGANLFVANYLRHIKGVADTRDIKNTENIIRFHSCYQHIKGNIEDGHDISLGQSVVTSILDGYIERFFD